MAPTAVEILTKKKPLNKEEIIKISAKWGKRTAKLGTKWLSSYPVFLQLPCLKGIGTDHRRFNWVPLMQ